MRDRLVIKTMLERHLAALDLSDVDLVVLIRALSVAAALIHLVVVPEHLNEATVSGVFFVVAAIAQLVSAFAANRRPAPASWLLVLGLNAALIATWAWSRSVGLPVGPDAGKREAVGLPDVVATLYEVGIVWAAATFWARRARTGGHVRDASSGVRLAIPMIVSTCGGAILSATH